MSYQAQTWVDETGIKLCANTGELVVMLRVANHTNGDMRGCYASSETLAAECLMGESTVQKHLRALKAKGALIPGDPEMVSHLRADRRPPVYDLAGGHEPGCQGGHSMGDVCRVEVTGARSEHPRKPARATGNRSEHPSKSRRSTGIHSEHPQVEAPATGVQIDLSRVFKSSTNSSKDLNSLFSLPADAFGSLSPQQPQEGERETAEPEDPSGPPCSDSAGGVPQQRTDQSKLLDLVLAGWAAGAELKRPPASVRAQLAGQVAELAADYPTTDELRTITEFAGGRRWVDLGRAAIHPECGQRLASLRPGAVQNAGGRERCPDHPSRYRTGCMDCAMAVPA